MRAWNEAWGGEVAVADVAAGPERFGQDLTTFGTHAEVVRGRERVEAEQWSKIWPAIEDFRFCVEDLEVLSPDHLMAVAIVPWTSTGISADGGRFDRPGRATAVLTRPDASVRWVGRHTHFSVARGVPQEMHGRRGLRLRARSR